MIKLILLHFVSLGVLFSAQAQDDIDQDIKELKSYYGAKEKSSKKIQKAWGYDEMDPQLPGTFEKKLNNIIDSNENLKAILPKMNPKEIQKKLKELQEVIHGNTDNPNFIEHKGLVQQQLGPQIFKLIHTFTDPRILDKILLITQKKNSLKYLSLAELLFLLLFLFYRSWKVSKIQKWHRIFLFNIISMIIFWLGSVFIVPYIVYGKNYRDLLKSTYYVVQENYFQQKL